MYMGMYMYMHMYMDMDMSMYMYMYMYMCCACGQTVFSAVRLRARAGDIPRTYSACNRCHPANEDTVTAMYRHH